MNEFERIEQLLAPLTRNNAGALDLKDDCALLPFTSHSQLAVTKDAIVEHVHFLPHTPPDLLAHKLLGVNLSDMAAMGAKPLYYFIAAALPPFADDTWFTTFTNQLHQLQSQYNITLMGGDSTSHTGPLMLSLTMMGQVKHPLYRSKARVGDKIYVTGTIGDAALGLQIAKGKTKNLHHTTTSFLLDRYHRPQPRVDIGLLLTEISQCATDISDGLIADLTNICHTSHVGARIYADRIPLSAAAKNALLHYPHWQDSLVTGGDDYELIFTISPEHETKFHKKFAQNSVQITCIGHITAENTLSYLDTSDKQIPLKNNGYIHF